jgi:hypothetical protein
MKLEFLWQIFDKSTGIKFYQNPSNGIRVVSYERMDRGADNMMKLLVAFYNFVNTPKN